MTATRRFGRFLLGLVAVTLVGSGSALAQSFELGAGFLPDPQTGTGTAGGARDAASFGPSCAGTVSDGPNHVLVVTSEVSLEIYVEASVDTTLVVTGNGQTFCADSGHGGNNPSLTRVFQPGTWQIRVGAVGAGGPYEIGITEAL